MRARGFAARKVLPKHSYVEIAITCDDTRLKTRRTGQSFFSVQGVPPAKIACFTRPEMCKMSFFTRSRRMAEKIARAFPPLRRKGFRLSTRMLKRGDWLDKWKKAYHIMPLGKKFMLVPLWQKNRFRESSRVPVYLEPESAFGTGTHETTRQVIRLMEGLSGRFRTFLDIGTGTGILCIAAAKLGAVEIWGLDRERASVRTARMNLDENRCPTARFFAAGIEKFRTKRRFGLVAANLLSVTLLRNKAKILSLAGKRGWIIVSGIGLENLASFRRDFASAKIRCLKILKGKKWGAILYRRS